MSSSVASALPVGVDGPADTALNDTRGSCVETLPGRSQEAVLPKIRMLARREDVRPAFFH